ncbi:MAG: acyl-CoA dehydrogenase family protein, partial [Solirubrobacterales bacterium]
MRFALTDEQSDLRASVRGALDRTAGFDVVREWLESGDRRAASDLCVSQGWTGVGVPDELGGEGGGPVELTIVVEEIARAALPGALLCHTGLAMPLVVAASDRAADSPAAALLAGERLATVLIDASDIPAAQPLEIGGGGSGDRRVTGMVAHVLGAPEVDFALIPVAGGRGEGEGLFAVSLDDPGVTLDEFAASDLSRRLASVVLDGVPAVRIGDLPESAVTDLANRAAVLIAADSLGVAAKMLEMTVDYVRDREQFGVPIGSFQAVKHEAAEMLVDVESSRSAAYFAAWSLASAQPDASSHAAAAKFVCAEAASRTADRALALHGAIGFTWEHDLHFLYKRAKANLALFGAPARYREAVA